MTNVLLVEPDDDFCLFLQLAISGAGCRTIITGSFAEANDALHGAVPVDVLVTAAKLPGGSGLNLARDAFQLGKRIFVVRGSRRWVELWDRQGILFRGDRLAVGDFLKKAIRRPGAARNSRVNPGRGAA
jgi:CheY-like chemotaxis protein